MRSYVVLIVASVLTTPCVEYAALGPRSCHADTVNEIVAAWKQREIECQTLSCTWDLKRFAAAGHFIDPQLSAEDAADGLATPPEEGIRTAENCKLTLQHSHFRYVFKRPDWDPEAAKIVNRRCTTVFDGKNGALLWDKGSEVPNGIKYSKDAASGVRTLRTLPLRALYRPFAEGIGVFTEADLSIDERLTDAEQIVLLHGKPSASPRDVIYVDRDTAMIRRLHRFNNGAPQFEIVFAYTESVGPFKLTGWKRQSFDENGTLTHAFDAALSSLEINPKVEKNAFRLVMPYGAWVADLVTGMQYMVKENGRKREILKEERFANRSLKELMATEAPSK